MRLPLVLLVALAVVLAGCRDGDQRREGIEEYIERANRTQAQFDLAFRQAQQSIRAFAAGRATGRTAERLFQASSTIRASRGSLALIEPPPDARSLHADLLRLLDLQARLALEVGLAAEYTTHVAPAIRPAQTAARALARELRSAATGDEQAVALDSYAKAIDAALTRFDALAVPPFLRPWHEDRKERLAESRREALGLAVGIRRRDAGAVRRALDAFTTSEPEDALRRAQTEAVKEFNRLLDRQERLVNRIAREQAELAEKFGS